MFQHDRFLTEKVPFRLKLLQMPKQPSKKWLNTLKNGTMEHQDEYVGCEQCKGPHYTKDCPQKEEGNTLEEAYYTQFGGPFQGTDICKKSQENGQNRTNTDTGTEEHAKRREKAIKNQE
ncbi:NADH dehydrogenase subunit 6, mitochondrial [Tanacetum coccineum]